MTEVTFVSRRLRREREDKPRGIVWRAHTAVCANRVSSDQARMHTAVGVFQSDEFCPRGRFVLAISSYFFYFKLVVVVRDAVFCGKACFFESHQALGAA